MTATIHERIESLNDGQRACLRLVRQAKKSEEIAHQLQISVHTVNKRIEGALRILGVGRRDIAAMMLERHEGGYEPLAYEALGVDAPLPSAPTAGLEPIGGGNAPIDPGRSVDLTWRQRIVWTVIVALVLIAVFGGAVAVTTLFQGAVAVPPSSRN